MMNLNDSTNSSCFSAIFDSSDPYENYPDIKNVYKEIILVAASKPDVNVQIAKMTIGSVIIV